MRIFRYKKYNQIKKFRTLVKKQFIKVLVAFLNLNNNKTLIPKIKNNFRKIKNLRMVFKKVSKMTNQTLNIL